MKLKTVLYLFLTIAFAFSCSSDKQEDGLPCIDVTKNYPEKEIILTDIADVSFVYLNSDNDDFLYSGYISCITKNTIVVWDNESGKILFFSKDGSPKSLFNRTGQGPEEYIDPHKVIYDEEADEVFIYSFNNKYIKVYSSTGVYKRKIDLPAELRSNYFYFFDDESFLLYDATFQFSTGKKIDPDYPAQFYDHPCIIISKSDGKILDYVKLPINPIDLAFYVDGRRRPMLNKTVISTEKGFLLWNPGTDTVFLYDKNKILTPIICKTPLVKDLDPIIYMNNCLDYGGYQFMDITTVQFAPELPTRVPIKNLVRNKKTGEVFRQKIIFPEYKGKEFIVGSGTSRTYEEGVFYELELVELKQADRENRLSGKLKELVDTLNEDEDNNVFMFVNFK